MLSGLPSARPSSRADRPSVGHWGLRWCVSGLLLAGGVVFSGPSFGAWIEPDTPLIPQLLLRSGFQFVAVLITAGIATVAFNWTVFRGEALRAVHERDADTFSWLVWPAGYLSAIIALRAMGHYAEGEALEVRVALTTVLTSAAIVSWALTAMPVSFWLRFACRGAKMFVVGGMVGAAIYAISHHYVLHASAFLQLRRPTLWTVYLLLRLTGKSLFFEPSDYVIGTHNFAVRVLPACSGLEGIALFCAFFAFYLWAFRRDFRFPQVFVLFPLGAIALWLLNSARIALLILLGGWSPDLAINGFHSVAGWLFFNAATLALVLVSQTSGFFLRTTPARDPSHVSNPAAPYLAPLMAIIAAAAIAPIFFGDAATLYPIRVVAGAVALWCYWRTVPLSRLGMSWSAVALGGLAFIAWLALQSIGRPAANDATARAAISGLPALAAAGWLLFRILGAVLLVPVAEELAFRGYALRKLVSTDFEVVSPRQFTWLSFLGSSVLFGVLHSQWLAGAVAGMFFALAVYRRGLLSDAVTSHATANGLLTIYVLTTGQWSLWE